MWDKAWDNASRLTVSSESRYVSQPDGLDRLVKTALAMVESGSVGRLIPI